ncbi:MAG: hydantoinase/oxoprolinase family protein [Alphaproteobacteria bacterium]|nr:hydantoinase/oxoprolinase family protein [Alphaproteobacteria bacterium]
MYYLGVDTGGTFTDFVLFNRAQRRLQTFKVRSIPADPAAAVAAGLARLEHEMGVSPADIERFIFGTTVATNSVLEKKGAAVALLTTRGVRDVLEIQRQWRQRLFDLYLQKPPPLVPRRHRLEVDERVLATGEVLVSLTEAEIRRCVDAVAQIPVEAVAISLLFSFLQPEHEQRLAAAIRSALPRLRVTTSYETSPEFREYERTATTVMNAYTMPKMDALAGRLEEVLAAAGFRSTFGIVQSNGGIMSVAKARSHSVNTLLSGPAGGVVGAAAVAGYSGVRDFVSFDVGGTSTDIALIEGGQVRLAAEGGIAGYPVKLPQVAVHTIGAGGGSIARPVLGMLKVGPESAGAHPGPACYGAGGTEPTGTDAAVALGYIDPEYFVGGEIKLDRAAAERAIADKVATPLGLTPDLAALAIIEVQVSNIVAGVRKTSVEVGKDPRDFDLLPFGGAGGLYAGFVAREAGMGRILLPQHPSVLSALGMLMTDIRHDAVMTRIARLDAMTGREAADHFRTLAESARQVLLSEGLPPGTISCVVSCDMRYVGQAYEINVPVPFAHDDTSVDLSTLRRAFDSEHKRLYGQCSERESVEIVGYRAGALGRVDKAELHPLHEERRGLVQPRAHRRVLIDRAKGWVSCPVFERSALAAHDRLVGPAIIEDGGSSFVLHAGHKCAVDSFGNLLIVLPPAAMGHADVELRSCPP